MATRKKKPAAKKSPAKKPATKKKAAAKKTAKKTAAKKTAKKTAPRKAAKKAPAKKKTAAKKAPTRKKAVTKKTAKKAAAAKKAVPKKAAPKKAAKKAPAKKKKAATATTGTRTIVQHVFLPAPPSTIYRMLTDPTEHGAFTGTVCEGEPIETGRFTASSGYISGRYEALEPDRLIVCSWQTSEWPKGAAPSRLEFVLEEAEGGTELTMTHSELPPSQAEDYRQGWIDFYWTPMREVLKG